MEKIKEFGDCFHDEKKTWMEKKEIIQYYEKYILVVKNN